MPNLRRHFSPRIHPQVGVALVLGVVLAGDFCRAQTVAPVAGRTAAPIAVSGAAPKPIPAPPLTDAQQAVLHEPFVTFVSSLAANSGIKLVPIPAGTFAMGSPLDEKDRNQVEGPLTKVTLTRNFFLSATEVTQGQYEAVMGRNPSSFQAVGKDAPVENVSWDDAMAFCEKLATQEKTAGRLPDGYTFTLPTEAQWEFACRAGSTGPFAGDLDAMAWYLKNSGATTHPVARLQANAWGLYDMEGNVMEWCYDWYDTKYPGGAVSDPKGPATGFYRVCRGGRWNDAAAFCRSAARSGASQGRVDHVIGFRLALSCVTSARKAPVAASGER